ncbi:MAG: succinate--CoA ligase subunit alpha, partial [Stackebrandtia sp.]
MAIFLTKDSKIIVQGMTGSEGRKHTQRMLDAGSQVVGGVTPGKSGQAVDFQGASLPVFGTVSEAMAATGADCSVVFVPPRFAKAAVIEATDAGIGLIVVITEGIPVHDTVAFCAHAGATGLAANPVRTRIIGPNCPGVVSPGASNAGIIPADITG